MRDNNNRLPSAEIFPTQPIDPQKPLPRNCDVLASYVGKALGTNSETVFKCPTDKENLFAAEGSSYEWNADLNGHRIGNSEKDRMEKVIGIGGIFFRAREPERLSAWYREHLGVPAGDGHADFLWCNPDRPDEAGRTVWAIFPHNSDYFGPTQPAFMIDYRVSNLDRMLEQLRRGGVVVEKVEDYDYGRFAWITDPEGNRIELWEPKTK
jgi:catechol 2,3-dioxygenase-like lactoylglutathione lyase family enzyme